LKIIYRGAIQIYILLMFRTFILLRLEQNIGRKGIFSPIHRPVGTKYLVEYVRDVLYWIVPFL